MNNNEVYEYTEEEWNIILNSLVIPLYESLEVLYSSHVNADHGDYKFYKEVEQLAENGYISLNGIKLNHGGLDITNSYTNEDAKKLLAKVIANNLIEDNIDISQSIELLDTIDRFFN